MAESSSGATLFMEPKEALPLNDGEVLWAAAVDEAEQAVRADLSALVAARASAVLSVQVSLLLPRECQREREQRR